MSLDFTGQRCEENINECIPNPCYTRGGGQCIDGVNEFRCLCTNIEWTGRLCDRRQLCLPTAQLPNRELSMR